MKTVQVHLIIWTTLVRTVDACKICAKCDKGFKIATTTNEVYNTKIKIRVGPFEKFPLLFVHQYGYLRQRHFTEEENS